MAALGLQVAIDQREMHRLVRGNLEEIIDKAASHRAPKPPGHIQRQVNRGKFDMRQGMPQGDPAVLRPLAALGHLAGRKQFGPPGPARFVGHGQIEARFQSAKPPVAHQGAGLHHLATGIGFQQCRADCLRDGGQGKDPSHFA